MVASFVLGLIAGEGSFSSNINVSDGRRFGVDVRPTFSLVMSDESAVKSCVEITNIGYISQRSNGMWEWRVRKNEEVKNFQNWVIQNSSKYFRSTDKYDTFLRWKTLVDVRPSMKDSKKGMKNLVYLARRINKDKNTRGNSYTRDELFEIIEENGKFVCGFEKDSGEECQFLVNQPDELCYAHEEKE
jgi:hypothetical protein